MADERNVPDILGVVLVHTCPLRRAYVPWTLHVSGANAHYRGEERAEKAELLTISLSA